MDASLHHFLQDLKQQGIRDNIPNISFQTGEILQFLAKITDAKRIFEIGCANGFSTIFLADIVRQHGGNVVTCDVSEPSFVAAQKNLEKAGLLDHVDFRFGDARKVLRDNEQFDYIFIDGQKNQTHEFFQLARRHLSPKGLIIIDDTQKFPEKMQPFYQMRSEEEGFTFCDIPVDGDDTLTIVFKEKI